MLWESAMADRLRLFYVVAYGPMHATGSWAENIVASAEGDAVDIAQRHLPEGFHLERVREYTSAPSPLLSGHPILNSPLTLGEWWKQQQSQPETTSEAAGQASLF
jgi:hypothetical protein